MLNRLGEIELKKLCFILLIKFEIFADVRDRVSCLGKDKFNGDDDIVSFALGLIW